MAWRTRPRSLGMAGDGQLTGGAPRPGRRWRCRSGQQPRRYVGRLLATLHGADGGRNGTRGCGGPAGQPVTVRRPAPAGAQAEAVDEGRRAGPDSHDRAITAYRRGGRVAVRRPAPSNLDVSTRTPMTTVHPRVKVRPGAAPRQRRRPADRRRPRRPDRGSTGACTFPGWASTASQSRSLMSRKGAAQVAGSTQPPPGPGTGAGRWHRYRPDGLSGSPAGQQAHPPPLNESTLHQPVDTHEMDMGPWSFGSSPGRPAVVRVALHILT